MNEWISVEESLPEDADYNVKLVNNGVEVVTIRRLISGKWYGGCRPFTDGEKVTHWKPHLTQTNNT